MPAKGQKISDEHRAALRAWREGQKVGESPTKHCPKCDQTKPRAEFGLRGANAQGKRYSKSYCKVCENLLTITKSRGNPEKVAASNRKAALDRYFSMTPEEFAELSDVQGGVCAICHEEPVAESRLHVDHDHSSGVVRGLLCRGCNHGLGNFRDSPELLLRAIEYLAREPIALRDGTTFSANTSDELDEKPLPLAQPFPGQLLIAEQLRLARGGHTKVSIARAIGTTPAQIAHLENGAASKGSLNVLFDLLALYGMTAVVTESGEFVVLSKELMDAL